MSARVRFMLTVLALACLPALAADAPQKKDEDEAQFVVMPVQDYARLMYTLKTALEHMERQNAELARQRREIDQLKTKEGI